MKTKGRSNSSPASGFGDVPASRPAELDSFDALVGRWDMEASFEAGKFGPGTPATTSRSVATIFEWLEGKFFLLQRFTSEHPAAPSGIAIIGPGAEPGTIEQHYYDSRGVARIYRTSLGGRTWKVWRGEAGSWQRYIGVISEDGTQIWSLGGIYKRAGVDPRLRTDVHEVTRLGARTPADTPIPSPGLAPFRRA